jgi:hypothetical protein
MEVDRFGRRPQSQFIHEIYLNSTTDMKIDLQIWIGLFLAESIPRAMQVGKAPVSGLL